MTTAVLVRTEVELVPAIIVGAGPKTKRRFVEFSTAHVRNAHTRKAYARAAAKFSAWCEGQGLTLGSVDPVIASAYVETLIAEGLSTPTVKQHLSALRHLCDWLVTGGALEWNPFAPVRGPMYRQSVGKTPVLDAEDARKLLALEVNDIVDLRDRALIAVMLYAFARVGAVVKLRVQDYETSGRASHLAPHEKGGKSHRVPCHHKLSEILDAYLNQAGGSPRVPLFRTVDRQRDDTGARQLTSSAMRSEDVLRMVKKRAEAAGLPPDQVCNHTMRATGITAYMEAGGSLDIAAEIAGHTSTKTTQLYNRARGRVRQDEIERIRF